ncbi:MAG TPA: response regulator [Coxiellaceae bacterium]|nr:response regulator [Coxiellaceae bacterium]
MSNPIVYIVDDNEGVIESTRWLIESVGYEVKTYTRAKDFLSEYQLKEPGCLVLDVRMPEISGLELQEALIQRGINLPIVFITAHGDVSVAVRAMKLGAVDFLPKPANGQILLEAINRAIRLDLQRKQTEEQNAELLERTKSLSPREQEVMKLVVSGKLTKTIADKLGVSMRTIEMHRSNIMRKMKVSTQAELAWVVLKNNLLPNELTQVEVS